MMRRRYQKLASNGGWGLVLILLFVGTVFIFGMSQWQSPVTREEAVPVQAALTRVKGTYASKHRLQEIRLEFSDHETLSIDSATATDSLLSGLAALPEGTICTMLIHPVGDAVLHLEAAGKTWLAFDKASRALAVEGYGFMGLGLCMYAGAGWNACKLLRRKRR